MGGVPYDYVVPYQEDVQAALDQLRREVFERGDYYGAEHNPRTIRDALEASEDSGTRSILDIERVTPEPDYCCAAPVGEDDLKRYFGRAGDYLRLAEAIGEDFLAEPVARRHRPAQTASAHGGILR